MSFSSRTRTYFAQSNDMANIKFIILFDFREKKEHVFVKLHALTVIKHKTSVLNCITGIYFK